MHSLQIRDFRLVEAVFIVRMHLKVWRRGCAIARFRHHIAAVAHEVVTTLVKRGVVGITRSYACGCICRQEWKWTNSCQRSYCHRCHSTGLKGWKLIGSLLCQLSHSVDFFTFRMAAWHSIMLTTLFIGITGVINTFQSVVACTAAQLWTTVTIYNLTRLKTKEEEEEEEEMISTGRLHCIPPIALHLHLQLAMKFSTAFTTI